jgi:hypothetical protein
MLILIRDTTINDMQNQPAALPPPSTKASELQVTALIGLVEVVLKSQKQTSSIFNLALITDNLQVTYSTSADGIVAFDNKIGNASIKTSFSDGVSSTARNVLTPFPSNDGITLLSFCACMY